MKLVMISGVLAVAAVAASAVAQPVITQTGQALDANPSIHSRYNAPALPNPYGLANQYGITGQLRLGRSFQGTMPYGSVGEFQGSLGSASLYNFERDSFSLHLLNQSRQGYSYNYVPPYINNTRTVFDAGRIAEPVSGQNPVLHNPFARPDYSRAQVMDTPAPAVDFDSPLMSTVPLPSMPLADQLTYRRQTLDAQEQMLRDNLPRGPGETTNVQLQNVTDPLAGRILQQGQQGQQPQPGDDPRNPQLGPLQPIRPDAAGKLLVMSPGQRDLRGPDQQGQPGQQDVQDRGQLSPGQDLFSDLLRRAQELKNQPAGDSPVTTDPAGTKQPDEVDKPSADTNDAAAKLIATAVVQPPVNLGVEHASLASKMPTRANSLMRQSEQQMAAGRFYDAARLLSQAKAMDPANPLIWLRSSHAYLAAGDFASAAADLGRAITVFPSIVSVRTELIGLSGENGKLAQTRLAQLTKIADSTARSDLRMLLCYAQMMAGRQPEAERSANLLLKPESGTSPQAVALARFVLKIQPK